MDRSLNSPYFFCCFSPQSSSPLFFRAIPLSLVALESCFSRGHFLRSPPFPISFSNIEGAFVKPFTSFVEDEGSAGRFLPNDSFSDPPFGILCLNAFFSFSSTLFQVSFLGAHLPSSRVPSSTLPRARQFSLSFPLSQVFCFSNWGRFVFT